MKLVRVYSTLFSFFYRTHDLIQFNQSNSFSNICFVWFTFWTQFIQFYFCFVTFIENSITHKSVCCHLHCYIPFGCFFKQIWINLHHISFLSQQLHKIRRFCPNNVFQSHFNFRYRKSKFTIGITARVNQIWFLLIKLKFLFRNCWGN